MRPREEKARSFRALHEREGVFVIPNPWDTGSARMLARLGFEALATTSAGYAFSSGRCDHGVGRNDMLAHVREIVAATDLPVSADLENGFGDRPEDAAQTIALGAAAGLCGGSIEDSTERRDQPLYEIGLAAERVRAAAQAARAAGTFVLTARAENFLVGRPDLKDTIARLQAYQEAGADVLYAPGLTTKEQIATVVAAVDRPINVLMGLPGVTLTVNDLSALGVRRISLGSTLARTAIGAFLAAAREIKEHGTFGYAERAATSKEISAMLAAYAERK
jgi:2-methylisocitrate lyase-like PEP mutase family enzyme